MKAGSHNEKACFLVLEHLSSPSRNDKYDIFVRLLNESMCATNSIRAGMF